MPTVIIMSAAEMNTPTATGQASPCIDAASSAAPGVDHASTMGIRDRKESAAPATPMPRHSAVIADPVCWAEAPSAFIACTISGTVPPKPTSAAISAVVQVGMGGRVRNIAMVSLTGVRAPP
jgi:hypothetical protein